MAADNSGNYDNCKRWCAARNDCAAVVTNGETCGFANKNCKKYGLFEAVGVTTFLKEVN